MPLLEATGLARDTTTFVTLEELDRARAPGERLGIVVPCDTDSATLAREAAAADVIAIDVPGTGDGRVFSLAATLREHGYRGTIRAVGPLIPDQFAFAIACGIDQVEIDEARFARQPLEQWLAAGRSVTRTYVGADGIFARRAST